MPRATAKEKDTAVPAQLSTIQKKKERAEAIKAAREKYSSLSRSNLPPPTTTVPLDRPKRDSVAVKMAPPKTSRLPPPGSVFKPDPAAAAAIRAGPLPATAMTGRPSTVPRSSLMRPSVAPRPSMLNDAPLMGRARLPRPSLLPRDPSAPLSGILPFGSNFSLSGQPIRGPLDGPSSSSVSSSSSLHFEPMHDSLSRILRNEPLPMAPGARASSIARRNIVRPSLIPGGLNIFSDSERERMEAERLQGGMTPGRNRLNRGVEDSLARSRVRFEVVQEQRESGGDEVAEAATSSNAVSSTTDNSYQSTFRREPPSLLGSMQSLTSREIRETTVSAVPPYLVDPPRSILKQKKSPRGLSSVPSVSSSSISLLASSSTTSTLTNSSFVLAAPPAPVADENKLPAKGTPSRARATPSRNGSAKNKKKDQGMMDVFAILNRLSEEEWRETPIEMITTCINLLKEKKQKKEDEEELTGDEEDGVMDRGILVEVEEEEEEEEEEAHQTMPLHDLTVDGTPRRRSSRIASNSQGKVARSLFLN